MKSTKFRPTTNELRALEVWSHRKFRGYVVYMNYILSESVYKDGSAVTVSHKRSWYGVGVDKNERLSIIPILYPSRRKAAIRLLTDHRFSAKVK